MTYIMRRRRAAGTFAWKSASGIIVERALYDPAGKLIDADRTVFSGEHAAADEAAWDGGHFAARIAELEAAGHTVLAVWA